VPVLGAVVPVLGAVVPLSCHHDRLQARKHGPPTVQADLHAGCYMATAATAFPAALSG